MSIWLDGRWAYGSMGNEHMARWTMSIWLDGLWAYGSMDYEHMATCRRDIAGRQASPPDEGWWRWGRKRKASPWNERLRPDAPVEDKKRTCKPLVRKRKLAGPSRDKDDLPRLTQLVTSKGYPPHIPNKALPGECRASVSGGRHHDIYTALRVTSRHGIDPDL